MDLVFRALNDPHRRRILDLLRERDGLTSSALESQFADISRFAVAKHLRMLEEATLISVRWEGRYKHHYLNAIPLQEIADRWISRFRAPMAMALLDLTSHLERNTDLNTDLRHVYVSIIKTSPEKLWAALTDPAFTPAYYYGSSLRTSLEPGTPFEYLTPDGRLMVGGEVLEATPYTRLVTTFTANFVPGGALDEPSRLSYEIRKEGAFCRLTVVHDNFTEKTATYLAVEGGWPGILSGLKTLLETGVPLGYDPMASNE